MQGRRIAAWAVTPALVGALSFTGASAAFASGSAGYDSHSRPSVSQHSSFRDASHPYFKPGVRFQPERQARYSNKEEVNRFNRHIKQGNRDVVVVVIVFIQWDNDNNCWVRSEQQQDGYGHNFGGERSA
jgi:hypothetical protein